MLKNLVIVESPAKAKTIEKFLGSDYKVLSSYGHIRDLKKNECGIDIQHDFQPNYEIPEDKQKLVDELREKARQAETVWLASDEDREGEAISWHLFEVLGLTPEHTRRIVFHEITKSAILKAIEQPREIDNNLVNAQQARRVLDRLVGFELSPVLWKKVKPALSAGRVQSVAVRLIVEREREVKSFVSESAYRVTAIFVTSNGTELKAELPLRFKTSDEAMGFLGLCAQSRFEVGDIVTRPQKKCPAPPFTTSTLQQEAARKLGFSVTQTMSVAQHLYESGRITYMRTDSVNLSQLALHACREVIAERMGDEYVKSRQFTTKSKGAQEAHEAIRPTDMAHETITGTVPERRLYELIWKRTIASQMADAEVEKTTVTIGMDNSNESFIANGEVLVFDGFLKVYRESTDDEQASDDDSRQLPALVVGEVLKRGETMATQRFSQSRPRYSEATLVKEMETLGIGRPSTYAPTISTIQQRGYVERGNKDGMSREYEIIVLDSEGTISKMMKTEDVGKEKNRLLPTDVGTVVNDFLMENFPDVLNYNFTADVEKKFDEVADGKIEWTNVIKDFYKDFEPMVQTAANSKSEHRVGERLVGQDPVSGKPLYAKIGRFGPVLQLGDATDEEKPRFAQIPKGMSMDDITLAQALDSFKLPRVVGSMGGNDITVAAGRFGPYIRFKDLMASVPKGVNPLTVNMDEAIRILQDRQEAIDKKTIKTFSANPDLQVLNGRYGAYISYQKQNYKIPSDRVPQELTEDDCMKIVEATPVKPKRAVKTVRKTRTTSKK
ncbi:MAG: type I DNA topoisomerase [Bacteroidales bacterium]|nr:type I DNA topoisomerase [Bacteroidales bacterium]